MTGNRLKLNNDKTKPLVVGSRRRVSVSQDSHLRVGSHDISFKSYVKRLGVYIDTNLSMAKHINHINRSAFPEIRSICSPSPDEEGHCSADVFLCSQSFGLLQLFTH